MKVGYKATKKFKVTNKTNDIIRFDILWNEIVNEYTHYGRPYFGLKMNNITYIDINKAQIPLVSKSGEIFAENLGIEPGATQNFEVTYEIKDNEEAVYNIGKFFYITFELKTR